MNPLRTPDHLTLFTRAWLPQGEAKAAVVLVHGINEHGGRYTHVAETLNASGYAVYALDHRGHGQSEGERVYITDFNLLVNDLHLFFEQVQAEQPGKQIFMLGHSMGAFVAVSYTLRFQHELAGLILSGAPLTIDTAVPSYMETIGNLLKGIAPRLPLVALELQAISRDPAVVAAYEADPLIPRTPVRVGMAVAYNQALKAVRARLSELRLPLLVLHGTDDRVVPASGSVLVHTQAASQDKTIRMYPGLYHEIMNEPEKETVLADIVAWLDKH